MLPITKKLTLINFKDRNTKPLYIVIHYVGAVSTAANNANYFHSTYRAASANYFVDETSCYQVVEDTDTAYHCGGSVYSGTPHPYHGICKNSNSIGIEMCCFNNNGKLDVSETVINNTIELTKYLMSKYEIPAENVIRHYDVTGKNCPEPLVSNSARWESFKVALGGAVTTPPVVNNNETSGQTFVDWLKANGYDPSYDNRKKLAKANGISNYSGSYNQNIQLWNILKSKGASTPTPTTPTTSTYTGSSLVDYLVSIGVDASYDNREKLAAQNGISNYTGSASQNTQLLNKLRGGSGSVIPTPAPTPTPAPSTYTGSSLVDYLVSIGVDSSYDNREKLAKANGISNYTGSASQNTQLLNKLRGGSGSVTPSSPISYYPAVNKNGLAPSLAAIGVDASYDNRKKIAKANGISNYTGSASQNDKLAVLLANGKLKKI